MASLLNARIALGNAWRTARAAAGGTTLVLTYHRVLRLESDPQLLTIDPKLFDEQMTVLAERFRPIRASDLASSLASRSRLPQRSVVVTFDDGYHDLLTVIKPILERHGVPATAFISTGLIGSDGEQWWDELEALLLGESTDGDDAGWDITAPPRNDSQRLYLETCDRLRGLDPASRESALEEIAAAKGLPRSRRPEYRMLSAEEIRELASDGLIEIGSHTVSHQMLAAANPETQLAEIAQGKKVLEDILGREIGLFSYPYGGADAVDANSREIAAETGHLCAFANWFGLTFPWTDRYAIPRCPTENLGGEAFAERLEQWVRDGTLAHARASWSTRRWSALFCPTRRARSGRSRRSGRTARARS